MIIDTDRVRVGRTVSAALLVAALTVAPVAAGVASGTPSSMSAVTSAADVTVEEITNLPDVMVRGAKSAHRITYPSVAGDGSAAMTKANVYVPNTTRDDGSYRVLAYTHGTVGVGENCDIGLKFGTGGRYDDWLGPWLEAGYVLVVPEYAGIGDPSGHAYTQGETAAKNTIDAVTAARTVFGQLSGASSGRLAPGFVTDGGSQGGHTSVWANKVVDTYGAETLVGSSAFALPADIGGYFGALTPGIPAVPQTTSQLVMYVAFLLEGTRHSSDPDARALSDSPVFTDLARSLADESKDLCFREMVERAEGIAPGDLVTRPLMGTSAMDTLRRYSALPTSGFTAPILVQQGGLDVVAPAAQVYPWAESAKTSGASVDVRLYPDQDHGLSAAVETNALAWAESLAWPE